MNDSKGLEDLFAVDPTSENSLDSARRQHSLEAATSNYNLVIKQQRLQTELDLTEDQAKRLVNIAAFHQSMGGGLHDITGSTGNVSETQSTELITSR